MLNGMVEIQVPPGVSKAMDYTTALTDLTIGSGAANLAHKAVNEAEQRTKAMVDGIIAMVDNTIQGLIDEGAGKMYEAMGINEKTIEMARTVINLAKHGTNVLASGVMKGMMAIGSVDVSSLPMSALVAGLSIIASIADMIYAKYIEAYQMYIDLIIEAVVNPGIVIEMLKDALIQIINTILDFIDEQIFLYTGYHLVEIYQLCQKGYNLYKQWKERKKKQREEKSETSVSIDVTVSPDVMKKMMLDWLKAQGDALYNAFMITQILDAIKSVKETVSALTDVSIESLAENINSLDDLIILLDELGLGDDSTSVDLSMIPSLNINSIMTSMNSLKENMEIMVYDAALMGTAAVQAGVRVDASVSKTTTYEINTDHTTKTISITVYSDPSGKSIANPLYKTLTNAKNDKGDKLFNAGQTKVMLDSLKELWNEAKEWNSTENKTFPVAGFNISLTADPETRKTTKSSTTLGNKSLEPDKDQDEDTAEDKQHTLNLSLTIMEDEYISDDNIHKNQRRNTIALLHMCYSLLKSMFPILKNIAVLIQNYKINKAYVAGKSYDNLYAIYKEVCRKLGLDKSVSMNSPTEYLYPVRTYALYRYIVEKLGLVMQPRMAVYPILQEFVQKINIWLDVNDPKAQTIPEIYTDVKILIDYNSVEEERKCIESQRSELTSLMDEGLVDTFIKECSVATNGTYEGIENLEMFDDMIMYSELSLPRMPSQILMAQMRRKQP